MHKRVVWCCVVRKCVAGTGQFKLREIGIKGGIKTKEREVNNVCFRTVVIRDGIDGGLGWCRSVCVWPRCSVGVFGEVMSKEDVSGRMMLSACMLGRVCWGLYSVCCRSGGLCV